MLRKLTINVSDEVYQALHKLVGQGNISQFVEQLVRPHLGRFALVSVEEGRGCVGYKGRPATDSEIRKAAGEAVRRRFATKLAAKR